MKLNVLYISHYSSLEGGANLSLLYLIEEMKKKGIRVYLLLPYKNREISLPFRLKGIPVIAYYYDCWMKIKKDVSLRRRCSSFVSNYISAYKIARIVKKLDINIIHTNSSVTNIGGLINKITGIPHVWHIREFGEEDYGLKFLYGPRLSQNFMHKYSTKIIAISKAIYDKYSAHLNEKLTIIYNGISKDYINAKKYRGRKDVTTLLLVGVICPGKGQLEAFMAVNHLVKAGYTNLHLQVAGNPIDTEYHAELKNFINKNQLKQYIDFIGFKKDLKDVRQATDIELMCSQREAFGRVTIEAMLSGNPVIGANSGGTKELLIEGYNGLFYKSGNYLDLADKIKYMIDNPEKLKFMGKNAFDYAIENFTAEKNAEEIYKIYSEILNTFNSVHV